MNAITFEGKSYAIPTAPTATGRYGIENLKPLVRFACRFIAKVREFAADGEYSLWEKIKTPLLLVDGLQFVRGERIQAMFKELLDLDESERDELLDVIAQETGTTERSATFDLLTTRILPLLEAVVRLHQALKA